MAAGTGEKHRIIRYETALYKRMGRSCARMPAGVSCYAAVCFATCSTGNAQVTIVPRPGAESIVTDPPCNSTKDRTSESPRPGPRCCDPIESVSNQSNTCLLY